jgi:hypothetical protein
LLASGGGVERQRPGHSGPQGSPYTNLDTAEDQLMSTSTNTTDPQARVSLPLSFANSTVIIEQVSDTELRIRKAEVVPLDEPPFVEECRTPLFDRDRDAFLSMLENPTPANEALKKAIRTLSGLSRAKKVEPFSFP